MDASVTFNSFRQAFSHHAQARPDDECLIVDGQAMSWREVGLWAGRLASRLPTRKDARQPQRAALLIDEATDFLGAFLGLIALGWAPIPVPDRIRGAALGALLRDCAPRVVVASPRYARELKNLCPSASVLLTKDMRDRADQNPLLDSTWESDLSPDDEMTIFYSSGTTSVPKGVLHTHRAHAAVAANGLKHWYIGQNERALLSAPIYTARALMPMLTTAFAGGTSIVNQTFDIPSLLSCVRHYSPHTIDLVPTQFMMLIDHRHFRAEDFACCRFIICGGAVLDPTLRERLFDLFPTNFVQAYGSTETCLISRLPRRVAREKRGSVGPPRSVEVCILGEDDRALKPGEPGEIAVSSPANFLRYAGEADSFEHFWLEPGTGKTFYRTGDLGRIDSDGYLWLTDRKKDMIITAGFKIYPLDMEAVLTCHPSVREAAVVGRPHAVLGETPIGFVTLKDQRNAHSATRSQILQWANGQLNANQRLLEVRIIESMPCTASGKPMKSALRQLAAAAADTDSSAAADIPVQ